MGSVVDSTCKSPVTAQSRITQFAPFTALVAIISLITGLYMGLWRGSWFDELLHFAMGGMTFEYLVRTIDYTTIHVNHGQTGFYMLVDWVLLQLFGASVFVLRLPSIASGVILLVSVVVFLRSKGFSWRWQALGLMVIGANESLVFYMGEARPYMPLAASAVVMLAYYSLKGEIRRTWWGRTLGFVGFLIGAAMHPYWIFIWFGVAAFSLIDSRLSGSSPRSPREIWRFFAPGFVIPSLLIYLFLGQLTWMRRVINFGWDRDSLYNWPSLINALIQDHFAFLPYLYPRRFGTGEINAGVVIPVLLIAVVILTISVLATRKSLWTPRLLAPALLLLLAIGTSVFVSYLSYRSQYIIFERQWVAGMALSGVAITWFFAEWWKQASTQSRITQTPVFAFVGLTAVSFAISIVSQLFITVERYQPWQEIKQDDRSVEELFQLASGIEYFLYEPSGPDQGYGYLASVNAARGGPVWEEFVRWYNSQAGMRQDYREVDSNWSDAIWPEPSPQSYLCLPERQWECPVP